MNRPLIALTLSLALGACVDSGADSALALLKNVAPLVTAEGLCVAPVDGDVFVTSGIIETASQRGYTFTPLLRNDLTTGDGEAPTRKSVFVQKARVTIEFFDPALFSAAELTAMETAGVTKFEVPTVGLIEPDGGTATLNFEILPLELIQAIAAKLPAPTSADPFPSTLVNAKVQVVGTISGSQTVSNVYPYPIQVCDGCLTEQLGDCATLEMGGAYHAGGACNLHQDGRLDCCTDATGAMVCPAAPPPTN